MTEPAGYKAPGQQGTGIVFILCLGLLLNIRVIAGPAFLTLQCENILCVVLSASGLK